MTNNCSGFIPFKNKLPTQSRVVRTTLLFDAPDLAKLIDSKFNFSAKCLGQAFE